MADVDSPVPSKPQADKDRYEEHEHHHAIYAAEATGLLVMAIVLLALIIIRYWRYSPWGAR